MNEFTDENGDFRIPKEVLTRPSSQLKIHQNRDGERLYFDQDVRDGKCFFCKRMGDAQKSRVTQLHHVAYDKDEPLRWTIEVCLICHGRIEHQKSETKKNYARRNNGRFRQNPRYATGFRTGWVNPRNY